MCVYFLGFYWDSWIWGLIPSMRFCYFFHVSASPLCTHDNARCLLSVGFALPLAFSPLFLPSSLFSLSLLFLLLSLSLICLFRGSWNWPQPVYTRHIHCQHAPLPSLMWLILIFSRSLIFIYFLWYQVCSFLIQWHLLLLYCTSQLFEIPFSSFNTSHLLVFGGPRFL